ncbi:MAG: PQQ-binding-like beta-propeller repeat protein [Candidatus Eremiobacteraeota bacterium]|nr:PQQ-binding-like beta-propeller repeat protein [Candidatus Eremiobacteraeota bacterium]
MKNNQVGMWFLVSLIAACLFSLFVPGCGGGGGGGAAGGIGGFAGGARIARIAITLPFPQKGAAGVVRLRGTIPGGRDEFLLREIPAGTTYFAIYIYERGTTDEAVPPVRVDRPASGTTATAIIDNVPIGWKTIRILASNASNEALAEAFYDINVTTGDNPEVTMTLTPTLSPLPSPSPMPTPTLSPSPTPEPSPSPTPSPVPSPQPPGPGPNPSPTPTSSPGALKWSCSLPGSGANLYFSSPAIASDGTLYVGSYDKKLYALSASGTPLWSFSTGGIITSSPVVGSDGTVYVGSQDTYLYALSASGTPLWSYQASAAFDGGGPAVGNDGSNDIIYAPCTDGWLYAINSSAPSSAMWSMSLSSSLVSNPAIDSTAGTIYMGTWSGHLMAFSVSDGSLKWDYTAAGTIKGGPSVGSGGTVYTGATNARLYSVTSSGSSNWSFSCDAIESQPSVGSDGTIYVGTNSSPYGFMYAINPSVSGSLKWSYSTGPVKYSAAAQGNDGTVYVGTMDGKLYALCASTGTPKWSYSTGNYFYCSPTIGSDGTIYIGAYNGVFYAIYGNGGGLDTGSPWPKFGRNIKNTGR